MTSHTERGSVAATTEPRESGLVSFPKTGRESSQTFSILQAPRFVDEQRYDCVGSEPYTRRDGRQTALLVWQTNCPVCGEPFNVRTAAKSRKFQPNRRCQKHKRPAMGVKPKVPPRGGSQDEWLDIHDHTAQLADGGILAKDAGGWV